MTDESKPDGLPDWANENMAEVDDEAVREFGRQLAMDGILRDLYAIDGGLAGQTKSIDRVDAATTGSAVQVARGERKAVSKWLLVALTLAASVLAITRLPQLFSPKGRKDMAPQIVDVLPEREDLAIAGWEIRADDATVVERVGANTLKLNQGELRVVARRDDGPQLKIITPNSEFVSNGSTCLVGAHTVAASVPSLGRLSRVLVLAGTATLSNSLGSVSGDAENLLKVAGDEAPVAMAVGCNSEFAIDLYREIAGENEDNVFISPYSISGALAMLLEGARGETAIELASVLHLPKHARRAGEDAQFIPWETTRLYSGISRLNEILGSASEEASAGRTKLERLGKELVDLRLEVDAIRDAPDVEKLRDEVKAASDESRPLSKERRNHERGSAEYVRLTEELEAIWEKQKELRNRRRNIVDRRVRPLAKKESRLVRDFNATLKKLGGYQLEIANAMWADQTLPIEQRYVDVVSGAFATGGLRSCDFRNQPDQARGQINQWIAENTNGRISRFLTPGTLKSDSRLVLTNAIYFLGEWAEPFKKSRTKPQPFTRLDGSTVRVPMMYQYTGRPYAAINGDGSVFVAPREYDKNNPPPLYPDESGLHLVSLPYRGNQASMVLIAPIRTDGLPELESRLTAESLTTWIDALKTRSVKTTLPKFRLKESYDLVEILGRMGIRTAFQRYAADGSGADFTGIADVDPDERLFVSDVLHKTFVDVNEEGTEAAAATVVAAVKSAAAQQLVRFIPEFRADRPFLFVIRHDETGAMLFMGRMMSPDSSTNGSPQSE